MAFLNPIDTQSKLEDKSDMGKEITYAQAKAVFQLKDMTLFW